MVVVIQDLTNVLSNNLISISLALGIVALLAIYYLLQRQIAQRRRAEIELQQQTKRERLVNQIAQHIRQSLNLDEVLVTTVAEVREFLACDRVLIYRIWEDGTGSAITETVLAPYPAILGETFSEEVFPGEYHQAYILGKTRAITNIDQADVELCLAEFVKQFQVKAKLVVPIIQEIRSQESGDSPHPLSHPNHTPYLWGLLIAGNASRDRNSTVRTLRATATTQRPIRTSGTAANRRTRFD
jgi:GAF domain-containing protein